VPGRSTRSLGVEMEALGFWTIVSSPIWMVFICVYADAYRTETARRLWWAAVIILVSGWAIYGLPDTGGELYLVGLATLVSLLLAMWALYVINTEPSEEDVLLNVAEANAGLGVQSLDVEPTISRNGKATRDDA
jgi:hypothetical protein